MVCVEKWSANALVQRGLCTVSSEIGYLHHVGHVVHDIEQARDLYRRLGFLCPAPSYPTLARREGEAPSPFGAANMHATFARNFVEVMAVVSEESHLPEDAHPIPLQVPPAALGAVIANIERTIAKVSASLARFEGLHILVFETDDASLTAQRFDQIGVGHSGINRVQQPGQRVPMGVIEIDREDVPEGRLAAAEAPTDASAAEGHSNPQHPNGAVDLIESSLCVPDAEIDAYVARYQRYVGREARRDGAARVFDLQQASVRLIPESWLADLLPGESAPALPGFVAYAVAVRDLAATRRWLDQNAVEVQAEPSGGVFVPAKDALGSAVIFRQVQ